MIQLPKAGFVTSVSAAAARRPSPCGDARRWPGRPSGARATPLPGGASFSLYSKHATGVELLFFDAPNDARPARTIRFDAAANRTGHYWHAFVPDVPSGRLYGYRVDGPFDLSRGLRFDSSKVLLDPYGRGVAVPKGYSRASACAPGRNDATAKTKRGTGAGATNGDAARER